MADEKWFDAGSASELAMAPIRQLTLRGTRLALTYREGQFGAISNACNHAGGPLGQGTLDGDYVVCPWHHWKFHRIGGEGERGFEEDVVPSYAVKVEDGRVLVNLSPMAKRQRKPHEPHPLTRSLARAPGGIRVAGISTTAMDPAYPRFSTSDALLDTSLEHARERGCQTQLLRLNDLRFRACEGYYSKSARACTWPCSITQMDSEDQMDRVYESFVFWADVLVVSTPIRWGSASSLYYKMVERMNCIQNQVTIANRSMLRNKVVALIITGGQDNVQAVAGQMLGFFAELGCQFPQYPYIAHSRGWTAEDMEKNIATVQKSEELKEGARSLVERSIDLAERLLATSPLESPPRGGRKGRALPVVTDPEGTPFT